jgi:uridylate kinase
MKVYNRVLLKLSGEALAGEKKTGFDEATCIAVAKQVMRMVEEGIQVSIVIGGGNFWRGRTSETIDRVKADQIGMLATVMNCIYVSDIFRYVGMKTEVYTPFLCGSMSQLFSKDSVTGFMKQGGVAFLAGGTGHPYFSTDTATVLRAVELDCDVILMARAVDGVYDSDPKLNPNARKFDTIPMQEVLDKKLGVADMTATVLALENKMPILLFGLSQEDCIVKAAHGTSNGTRIIV